MAENLMLRKQLLKLWRKHQRSPKLSSIDRVIFAILAHFVKSSRLIKSAIMIKPATILKLHQALIKRQYCILFSTKSPRKPGPKGPSNELIHFILEMKKRNPNFSYVRIAMQIKNMFDINIDKDVVRQVLQKNQKHYPSNSGGPSWLAFVGNMKDSLWSIDFFRCEAIFLKSHWVMVVMDQFTRRIVGFSTHAGDLNGIAAVCCMFNKIISKQSLLHFCRLIMILYFNIIWKAYLRILDIKEIKTLPYMPMSHPFVERLIRSIRHELLDQTLFWHSDDLQRKLDRYQHYFNSYRSHQSLSAITPYQKAKQSNANVISIRNYKWQSYCNVYFNCL